MAPGATPKKVINVPTRTLDRILEQAGSPAAFDFLSMDVEGPEIDALRGFDIARWQPKLILIEGHVAALPFEMLRNLSRRLRKPFRI